MSGTRSPEIKRRFGIDVKMTALPVGPLHEKRSQSVKAPTSSFDAIMVLGFTVSAMVGGGFFEPLNSYLKKVPSNYDFPHDFPAGELRYVGYYDVKHQRFGGNTLYLIPGLHGGSVVLFYRKDLLRAAGLRPPTTWAAYLDAAKKLNTNGVAGNSMIAKSGDVSMFLCDWYTRFANMGGQADERVAADQELPAAADEPGRGCGAPAHGRVRGRGLPRRPSPTTSPSRPTRSAPARPR